MHATGDTSSLCVGHIANWEGNRLRSGRQGSKQSREAHQTEEGDRSGTQGGLIYGTPVKSVASTNLDHGEATPNSAGK